MSRPAPASGEIGLLLRIVDEAYEKAAWHGPNLRGALRGVGAAQAAWRPARGRHNIWELALHAAYWKYAAWRRLTGGSRGAFPVAGSNWFARPGTVSGENAWRGDLTVLAAQHRKLREAVRTFPPRRLHVLSAGSKHENARLIYGIAAHDLYHTGQIQVLKRLYASAVPTRLPYSRRATQADAVEGSDRRDLTSSIGEKSWNGTSRAGERKANW